MLIALIRKMNINNSTIQFLKFPVAYSLLHVQSFRAAI